MIEHLKPTACFIIWDKVQPEDFTMAMCEFAWTSMDTPAKIATNGNINFVLIKLSYSYKTIFDDVVAQIES